MMCVFQLFDTQNVKGVCAIIHSTVTGNSCGVTQY